jgi:hypothetical protein
MHVLFKRYANSLRWWFPLLHYHILCQQNHAVLILQKIDNAGPNSATLYDDIFKILYWYPYDRKSTDVVQPASSYV